MASFQLNPDQKKAVLSEGNTVVTAGAGSGKTLVLVERYLWFLLSRPQLSVRNAVAITFTNKAASEMKERVRERLNTLLDQPNSPERMEHLARIKDDLHLAYISTIHSLCARILREFPLEADVDPNFSALEAPDASLLITETISETFQDISALAPDHPLCQALTFLVTHWGRNTLATALEEMMQKRWPVRRILTTCGSKSDEQILANWTALAAELHTPSKASDNFNRLGVAALKHLAMLFPAVLARYEERKGLGLVLDFDDLLEKTLHLLSTAPHVRQRLSSRFHTILVDEFQDTDPLQWEILRLLISTNGTIESGKIFIVGDPKQSIYGFRNADMRIFYHVKREITQQSTPPQKSALRKRSSQSTPTLPSSPIDVPMNTNYRSLPAIINLVNLVFEEVMSPPPQLSPPRSLEYAFEVEYEPLTCHRETAEPGKSGQVELFLVSKPASDESQPSATPDLIGQEAELIARRILAMVRACHDTRNSDTRGQDARAMPLQYGDVAILLRQRTHLKIYEQALRRYDIPYITVGGIGFFRRQELLDLYNLIEFLVRPENDTALVGLLRSPLCGFSDCLLMKIADHNASTLWQKLQASGDAEPGVFSGEEQRLICLALENLRYLTTISQRTPPSLLLITALERTGAWASLAAGPEGEQRLANIDKLLTLARAFESTGFVSLSDFLDRLRLQIEDELYEGEAPIEFESRNAVKIMTIHKAKGLEFPVVFVPDLHTQIRYAPSTSLLIDDDYGLGMKLSDPEQSFELCPTTLHRYIYQRLTQKVIAEEKRLFYVAMTRAKDHLVLSATVRDLSKMRKNSWLYWLNNRLHVTPMHLDQKHITFTRNNKTFSIRIYTSPDDFEARPHAPAAQPAPYELLNSQLAQPILESDIPQHIRAAIQRLSPLKQDPPIPSYAVTQLLAFSQCPLNYYFKYVLGASNDVVGAVRELPLLPQRVRPLALLRGTLVHHAFEALHLPAMRNRSAYVRTLLASYPDLAESERSEFASLIHDALSRFEQSPLGRTILASPHYLHEAGFQLLLNNTAIIRGKADLLFQNPRGSWELLDFKTDTIQPEDLERAAAHYSLQIELYALFLSRLYPHQPSYQAHLYFTHIADACTKTFDHEALKTLETELGARINELTRLHAALRTPDAQHTAAQIDSLKSKCQTCEPARRSTCVFLNH
jgi:ATP-dependent helicase/nuclease subunit A